MKSSTVILLIFAIAVIAIVVVALAGGMLYFKRSADHIGAALMARRQPEPRIVTAAMLDGLPAPVQRYLTYSGVIGKPMAETVRLKQRGRIRQDSSSPWMPLTADEYYSVNPPGLLWFAKATMNGIPFVRVQDTYIAGKGRMNATIAGLVPVFDMTGPELDQGSFMRYLNEMMWFPSAFLNDNVSWQAVDDQRAIVTLRDGDLVATATLFFDAEGRITNFLADRYRDNGDGTSTLMLWSTPVLAYREYPSGLRLPSRGAGVWHLPTGEDLTYVELDILEVEENESTIY